mgnify:CR=1 FL=1
MNDYALTIILKPDLEEKVRVALLESVTKKFGKMDKEDLWGSRDLAYPIKRESKGWYAHYQFSAEPSVISSLDKILKIEEDILRYLLLRM